MECAVNMARKGKTVVATIHQPNSDITDMFDDFVLLAFGCTVYGGPWKGAVGHFTLGGFECPTYKNPTDFFMSVIKDAKNVEKLKEIPLPLFGMDIETGLSVTDRHTTMSSTTDRRSRFALQAPDPSLEEQVPSWYQTTILIQRLVKTWIRNPVMLASEVVQYAIIALFIGLMYHGSFTIAAPGAMYNRSSAVFFAFAVMSFTPSFTAITTWQEDRHLVKREITQRQYTFLSYYLSRNAVLYPLQIAQCLLFSLVSYFFSGFQVDFVKFIIFFAGLTMFQIICEGIGWCCALITRTAVYAIIFLTFMLLLILAFSGFLITTVPVYFVWVQKMSFFTYAYIALLQVSEFFIYYN
jgi:hypothetical protein